MGLISEMNTLVIEKKIFENFFLLLRKGRFFRKNGEDTGFTLGPTKNTHRTNPLMELPPLVSISFLNFRCLKNCHTLFKKF